MSEMATPLEQQMMQVAQAAETRARHAETQLAAAAAARPVDAQRAEIVDIRPSASLKISTASRTSGWRGHPNCKLT